MVSEKSLLNKRMFDYFFYTILFKRAFFTFLFDFIWKHEHFNRYSFFYVINQVNVNKTCKYRENTNYMYCKYALLIRIIDC